MMQEKYQYSPLKLLYSAYSDEQPIASQIMEEGFREMDKYLELLPRESQEKLFQTFCNIYMENERISFRAGLCTGFQLAQELRETTFD